MRPHDSLEFAERFPSAVDFLQAAELRREYWCLCAETDHLPGEPTPRSPTPWQLKRLEELRQCPACHEAWFVLEVGRAFGQWPDGQAEVGDAGS
jgi:hypothetical protein